MQKVYRFCPTIGWVLLLLMLAVGNFSVANIVVAGITSAMAFILLVIGLVVRGEPAVE